MVQEFQTEESKLVLVLIFAVIFLLIIIIGVIFFFFLSRRKIIQKEKEKADLRIANQEKILQTSIAVQETERKRIAQDLHDAISSKLNVVSLTTNVLLSDNQINEKQKNTLEQILDITSTTLESSRQIAHDLLPPILDKFGLKAALEELFEDFSKNTTIEIAHNIEELKLSETNQLHLFRIAQELINNSIRHGMANKIEVNLLSKNKGFKFNYSDNGGGFNVSEVNKNAGIGLQNIKSRVKILDADLNIDSVINQGSRFVIQSINEA